METQITEYNREEDKFTTTIQKVEDGTSLLVMLERQKAQLETRLAEIQIKIKKIKG